MPSIVKEVVMTEEESLLCYRHAAKVLGLPLGTLYSLVSQRRIPHIRLGPRLVRFRQHDLRVWIAANRVGVLAEA